MHSARDLRIDSFPKDMSLMDEEKPKQVTSLETVLLDQSVASMASLIQLGNIMMQVHKNKLTR